MSSTEPGEDPHRLGDTASEGQIYDAIERAVLGEAVFTRQQVAESAEVDLQRAIELWHALGLPAASDDDRIFTEADVEALRSMGWLTESGVIDSAAELTVVRSMGRSFARLAEWYVTELAAGTLTEDVLEDPEQLREVVAALVPVIESVQNHVWRRHLANAAGRILLHPGTEEGTLLTVGFADIVGFTRKSRGLTTADLAELIEIFEATTASIVTDHGGRIIKMIGDEVMFVADEPDRAAHLALALVEAANDEFPQLRVGLAHGVVLSKLGDVFGEVVNVASRLTSLARPGTILVDRGLREALREAHEEEFRIRRGRTTAVRGYARLDTWTLRRPKVATERPTTSDLIRRTEEILATSLGRSGSSSSTEEQPRRRGGASEKSGPKAAPTENGPAES